MANKDGDSPAQNLAHFQHPQQDGRVHYIDQSWPIVAGVVECPIEVGQGADWLRATPEQIAAYQKGAADHDDAPDVLTGSVADVVEHLATVETLAALDALADVEAAGKNRKGVIEAIEERRSELTADQDDKQ